MQEKLTIRGMRTSMDFSNLLHNLLCYKWKPRTLFILLPCAINEQDPSTCHPPDDDNIPEPTLETSILIYPNPTLIHNLVEHSHFWNNDDDDLLEHSTYFTRTS